MLYHKTYGTDEEANAAADEIRGQVREMSGSVYTAPTFGNGLAYVVLALPNDLPPDLFPGFVAVAGGAAGDVHNVEPQR